MKEYRLDALFPLTSTVIADFIRNTARAGFPVLADQSGNWTVVDPPPSCASEGTGNCIRYGSFSSQPCTEVFTERLLSPLIPPGVDLTDPAALNDNIAQLNQEWRQATLTEDGALSADRINLYQQVLAGGSRLDDAFVQFPTEEASLRQTLEIGSRLHSRLIVRLFYGISGNDAALTVHLNGQSLDATAAIDPNSVGFRREFMFTAVRDGATDFGQADTLTLTGKNVRVYAVSVRSQMPQRNPINGHFYEYMLFDGGTDWEAARAMAERRVFRGRKGQLATFALPDIKALHEVRKIFAPDTVVWLGAKGVPTDDKAFTWLNGQPFLSQPWHRRTTFDPDAREESYLFVYPDGRSGSCTSFRDKGWTAVWVLC